MSSGFDFVDDRAFGDIGDDRQIFGAPCPLRPLGNWLVRVGVQNGYADTFRASSVARMTAEVDFPAPPLGLAKTIVGMMNKSEVRVAGKRLDIRIVTDSFPVVNGKPFVSGKLTGTLQLSDG